MNQTISQVIDTLRLSEWRMITIAGRPYRTHPDNVPEGTGIGDEFVLSWRIGKVWARLVA